MVIAIAGGVITGFIMKMIAKFQGLADYTKKMEMLQKLGKAGEARSVVQASFKHPGVKESEWFDELNQEL